MNSGRHNEGRFGWRALGALVTVSFAVACSTDAPTGPGSSRTPPPPPSVPTSVAVAAGDVQSAPTGGVLPTAPEVRVTTSAGAAVSGVTVRFDVIAGGGSIERGTASTDAAGMASGGIWTLGGSAGTHQLRATVDGVGSVTFTATATAQPAALAVMAGDGQSATVGTEVAVPPEVRVTDDNGDPVGGVTVTFSVVGGGGAISGAVQATDQDGRARTGGWTLGNAAGTNSVTVVVGGASISVGPVTFIATGLAGPAANAVATQGDGQTLAGGTPVLIRPQVRVTDVFGNPVPGLTVTFAVSSGGGSVSGGSPSTSSAGRATVGGWTLGSAAGANTLTATVASGGVGSPVTFSATSTGAGSGGGSSTAYDIEIRYNPGSSPTAAQSTAFVQAKAKWEAIIAGDLIDTPVNRPAGTCTSTAPLNETVDDLVVFVTLEAIDGAGGVLGSAGPCLIRSGSLLTLMGQMRLDVADLAMMEAAGTLDEVIAHEMGHVLGIGSLWAPIGLLAGASGSGGTDPHFTGSAAIPAFNSVGGSGYGGLKVPVEANGGSGTADSHWRESVFGKELMTGWVNAGSNPLSLVTVQSLADLGYSVVPGQADSYALTISSLVVPGRGRGPGGFELVDDVWWVPLEIVSPTGRRVGLIPR